MKKQFTILIFLLLTVVVFGQFNDYDLGFKNGYKEGYCYNDFRCIAPIPPITPIPLIGESNDNYQDGYNRGFERGLSEKRNKISNSSQISRSNLYVSSYVPIDYDLYAKALDLKNSFSTLWDYNMEFIVKVSTEINSLKKRIPQDSVFLNEGLKYFNGERGLKFFEIAKSQDYITEALINKLSNYSKQTQNEYIGFIAAYAIRIHLFDGLKCFEKKNFRTAIYHFSAYLKEFPKEMILYYYRGLCYFNLSEMQNAKNDFDVYIAYKPNDIGAYEYRGLVSLKLNYHLGAIHDFNKQIELDPTSSIAYLNRGIAKSKLKDYYGAIVDYNKSIEINNKFSMAYNNRGWAKYELKKYSEALKDLNKSIELDPTNWNAFDSRQEIRFALNDLKGCIEDCNSAIALNPKVDNSYFYRGRAYYKQGNKTKACEDWSKAGELGKIEAYVYITKYCNN